MYSIEALTGRYVSFWHRFNSDAPLKVPEVVFFGALSIDQSKQPILHTHYPYHHLTNYSKTDNKLIFILRNPKEYLIRRAREQERTSEELHTFITNPNSISHYMGYLLFFESWDEDQRLLIYYEDLVDDCRSTMLKVLKFLEESPDRLDPFIENKSFHEERLLKYYNRIHRKGGGSMSKGRDLVYHSRNVPQNILKQIDNHIQDNYPNYWNHYFVRFKEPESP